MPDGRHDWHSMRISVSNWRTTEADVDRSVAAIRAAWQPDGTRTE